jgi:ABC-type multidrug transport system ATPase subunit
LIRTVQREAPAAAPDSQTREAIISIRGLCKSFPVRRSWLETIRHPRQTSTIPVVRDATCDINRGEFFGLLGPNGAGKTTLFKILATLIRPDSGTAIISGMDVVDDPAGVRRVLAPVIASERSLYWRISARENLKLYATLQGLAGSVARRRVDEALETIELADTGNKMVGQFSSGMKQRLLIGRALLARPEVLLLDEPTRSLDPISARRFRSFLKEEIIAKHGCTVLLATHTTEEALELCDRVGVLDGGRLVAVGTADALAAEVGEDRYRVWTTAPGNRCVTVLGEQGVVRHLQFGASDSEGWGWVEIDIPGGPQRAADVLAFLVENGIPVARFERVPLSLADLIERVVAHRRQRPSDA